MAQAVIASSPEKLQQPLNSQPHGFTLVLRLHSRPPWFSEMQIQVDGFPLKILQPLSKGTPWRPEADSVDRLSDPMVLSDWHLLELQSIFFEY